MKYHIIVTLLIMLSLSVQAQRSENPYSHKFTLLSGLGQCIVGHGVNVAGTYFTQRVTFEYSHGMFLTYKGVWKTDKHIESIYALYSTGFGVGYRLMRHLDLRAETKMHRLTAHLNDTQSVTYTNFDLGGGAFYRIYPFAKKTNTLSGIVLETSLRYWEYIHSTLPGDRIKYVDNDGKPQTHTPYNFGLFANLSIGYTF